MTPTAKDAAARRRVFDHIAKQAVTLIYVNAAGTRAKVEFPTGAIVTRQINELSLIERQP